MIRIYVYGPQFLDTIPLVRSQVADGFGSHAGKIRDAVLFGHLDRLGSDLETVFDRLRPSSTVVCVAPR